MINRVRCHAVLRYGSWGRGNIAGFSLLSFAQKQYLVSVTRLGLFNGVFANIK
jgi:hypothetical protein